MKALIVISLATIVLISVAVSAQVVTGTPQFSSVSGGPFDAVNIGNLNVHFAIPILHKAGRGMSFSQGDLTYESSIWIPVGSSGSQSWQPDNTAPNNPPNSYWGWQGLSNSGTSYITYVTGGGTYACGPMGQYQ